MTRTHDPEFDRSHVLNMLETCHGGQPKIWTKEIPSRGENRKYEVFILRHAQIVNVTPYVARIAGYRYNLRDLTLTVTGHGYSGAQDIRDNLSRALYNDSDAIAYEEF